MGSILNVVKVFLISILVVAALKFKVGSKSIEDHTITLAQSHYVFGALEKVAQGASILYREITQKIIEYKKSEHN